jgi:aspartyl-tRNA(Asn)/glutamyl-tRNA(Gln) amidotransferase subunit C
VSIGRDDVLHVAKLAELAVPEEELDRLVQQLNRIVDYVAALDRLPADPGIEAFLPGPQSVGLRVDEPGPVPLLRPPAELAPEWKDGFFLVPRHGAMEDP